LSVPFILPAIVQAALFLLCQSPAEQDLRELIQELRSDAIEDRDSARRKLKEAGRAALPELERAQKDPDSELAARARELIRVIETREKLSNALRRALPEVEEKLALGGDVQWTKAFFEAVARDPKTWECRHPELRRRDLEVLVASAVRGARTPEEFMKLSFELFGHPYPTAIPELTKRLAEPAYSPHAKTVLSGWAYPATLEAVVPLLRDPSPDSRRNAAEVLGGLRLPEAGPELVRLLEDPVVPVRGAAIRALGMLRHRPAGEAIRKCLQVRGLEEDSLQALGQVRYREAAGDVEPFLDDRSLIIQGYAAQALGELGSKGSVPRLRKMLAEKPNRQEGWAAALAVGALGRLGDTDAIGQLRGYLESPDVTLRAQSIVALGRLEDRESARRLLPALSGRDIGVLGGASHVLRHWNPRQMVPEMIARVKDRPAEGFLGGEISTLAGMGVKEAIPAIVPYLKGATPYIRAMAGEALARLGSDLGVQALLEEHGIGPRMITLNALRTPDLFHRLEGEGFREDFEGRTPELLEEVSRHLGLKLDLSMRFVEEVLPDTPPYFLSTPWYWLHPQAIDFLDWAASIIDFEIILETDRIRVVSREEALAFWKAWWEEREKKGKK
jgi:HEAT repeat protein